MKRRLLIVLVLSLVLIFAFTACTSAEEVQQAEDAGSATEDAADDAAADDAADDAAAATDEEQKHVVFAICGTGNSYTAGQVKAMTELVQPYGWKLTILDGEFDPVVNAKNLDDAIAMDPDLILLMPIDSTAVSAGIKKAYDAGIPILVETISILQEDEMYTVGYTGPNDYQEGELAGGLMNEVLGLEGNIVIIEGQPGQKTTDDRQAGFVDVLEAAGSNAVILDINNGDYMKERAVEVMENFLTTYGDEIDAVYCHDDQMATGAATAIREAGYEPGDFIVIGVGGNSEGLQYVKDGWMTGTMLQSPTIAHTGTCVLIEQIFNENIGPGQEQEQLPEYFNYMDIPVVTVDNVEEFLPGDW